jgi:hypothetical protein
MSMGRIGTLLRAANLSVESVYGDWDSSMFDAANSPEMIFVVSPLLST